MHFDVLMPSILFMVTLASVLIGRKAETKLKTTVETREFKPRDTFFLVLMIAIAISVVIFVPSMAIIALFLFSYSTLLFAVSYAFSDLKPSRLKLYCGGFIVASAIAALASYLGVVQADLRVYATGAFASLALGAFFALFFALRKGVKPSWYVATLSPVLFLLLFTFYGQTNIGFILSPTVSLQQFPYLLDIYGITFAILIVIYLGSLFSWKTVFIFAALLTGLDIVLVWITGTMVQAAQHISGLGLPVLVAFPTLPVVSSTEGILILRLGLGDFFFAGILSTQTTKRFGLKTAIVSLLAICISFGIFELILLNPELIRVLPVPALPATLPILLGWLPVILVKMYLTRNKPPPATTPNPSSTPTTK